MSKKECLDDMFLNRISIIVGQEDENQIKQEIEQIGYKEFYRYNQEKRYMIEQQKIEIKNKDKEIEKLNNIINELEKWLIIQHDIYINIDKEENTRLSCQYLKVKDKLQELKGSDKE